MQKCESERDSERKDDCPEWSVYMCSFLCVSSSRMLLSVSKRQLQIAIKFQCTTRDVCLQRTGIGVLLVYSSNGINIYMVYVHPL